ncbi:hypothetical protein LY78DRAFT_185046 [Colletotrichum sublineola]|nr:hypothetical protein LY78DRAFT_185046 [Colletotrichum sublineola]
MALRGDLFGGLDAFQLANAAFCEGRVDVCASGFDLMGFFFQVSFGFPWCRFPIKHSSISRLDTFGGVGWAFALDFFSTFTSIRAALRAIISTGLLLSLWALSFLLCATILHLAISSLLMLLCVSAFVRLNHILLRFIWVFSFFLGGGFLPALCLVPSHLSFPGVIFPIGHSWWWHLSLLLLVSSTCTSIPSISCLQCVLHP